MNGGCRNHRIALHRYIQAARLFSKAKISLPRRRQSPPRTDDADIHLIDVMRHGAAGIIWSDEELEQTALACKLLCKANDFDFTIRLPVC